ncbi:MAG: ribonuclease HI family protein [Patescibacteria group bacterium]
MQKIHPPGGKVVTVYADGSVQPDYSGAGTVIVDASGFIIAVENRVLPHMTNNEAEYEALILGLEMALKHGAVSVEVRMDSEVVINQMKGLFGINSPKMKEVNRRACILARQIKVVEYIHIPRDANEIADALAGEASAGREWKSR